MGHTADPLLLAPGARLSNVTYKFLLLCTEPENPDSILFGAQNRHQKQYRNNSDQQILTGVM